MSDYQNRHDSMKSVQFCLPISLNTWNRSEKYLDEFELLYSPQMSEWSDPLLLFYMCSSSGKEKVML
jgi:hypothetical protein